jgi:hypothetical protein
MLKKVILFILISIIVFLLSLNKNEIKIINSIGFYNYYYYYDMVEYIAKNEGKLLKPFKDINNNQQQICCGDREYYLELKKANKLNDITAIDCKIKLYQRVIDIDKISRKLFSDIEIPITKRYKFFQAINDIIYMTDISGSRFKRTVTAELLLTEDFINDFQMQKKVDKELQEIYITKNKSLNAGMFKRYRKNANLIFLNK